MHVTQLAARTTHSQTEVSAVLRHKVLDSLLTPPGSSIALTAVEAAPTHSMMPTGTGFCILNDIAVTAKHLLQQGAVQRVMTVDLDVHQVTTLTSKCVIAECLVGFMFSARSCMTLGLWECLLTNKVCWACSCSLCVPCNF